MLLFLFLSSLLVGCTNATDPPAATNTGSKLTGSVATYSATTPMLLSPLGIQVTIQGTPFQAVSDSADHFEIDNIPAGVYNIIFSKPGFDSMIYPVHHLIGAGTDIINDAYLVAESSDTVALNTISSVFTVSISKTVRVIDTIIKDSAGVKDTIVLSHDSLSITYDTVQNADALIVSGRLMGNVMPGNLFVYSSLDSSMWPANTCRQNAGYTEDAWLATHVADPSYHGAFQSPRITGGTFTDTLARDVVDLTPYSLGAGQSVYIFVVGHSNTTGLPATGGEYQHYYTTPYGPQAVRFRYIVP